MIHGVRPRQIGSRRRWSWPACPSTAWPVCGPWCRVVRSAESGKPNRMRAVPCRCCAWTIGTDSLAAAGKPNAKTLPRVVLSVVCLNVRWLAVGWVSSAALVSEHGVFGLGRLRHDLRHIPVLNVLTTSRRRPIQPSASGASARAATSQNHCIPSGKAASLKS